MSRSKLENFLRCPRCFYLDRRLGVDQPPGFPFNLNSAVDHLLKKEFDVHRADGSVHPLLENYGLTLVPLQHESLPDWRDNFKGIGALHQPSNFYLYGAVDDVWVDDKGRLTVVDYKATSKDSEVNLDADWQRSYKNQVEIYQWLFEQNNFKVSPTAYFVYVNGRRDREAFDGKLEFDVKLIPYEGSTDWIEGKLMEAKKCLLGDLPPAATTCDYCAYRLAASRFEK